MPLDPLGQVPLRVKRPKLGLVSNPIHLLPPKTSKSFRVEWCGWVVHVILSLGTLGRLGLYKIV